MVFFYRKGVKNIMNRKIALSAISILSTLALVGGATFAAFSSSATNPGNTFGAGTLVLNINGAPGSSSSPKFTIANAYPGQVETQVIVLSNSGTVPSSTTKLTSIAHSTSTSPDLGDKLTLELWDDVNGDDNIDGGDVMRGSAHITDPAWSNIDLGFGLTAGGSHQLIARVTFDAGANDTYQGSNSTFDFNFQANQ